MPIAGQSVGQEHCIPESASESLEPASGGRKAAQ